MKSAQEPSEEREERHRYKRERAEIGEITKAKTDNLKLVFSVVLVTKQ